MTAHLHYPPLLQKLSRSTSRHRYGRIAAPDVPRIVTRHRGRALYPAHVLLNVPTKTLRFILAFMHGRNTSLRRELSHLALWPRRAKAGLDFLRVNVRDGCRGTVQPYRFSCLPRNVICNIFHALQRSLLI